jgi:hypothetical protein
MAKDQFKTTSIRDEKAKEVAEEAWQYIEEVARPFVRAGGKLATKTPSFYGVQPTTELREILKPYDQTFAPVYATKAAMLPDATLRREHALPVKRIIIELIDPMQGDIRCNSNRVLVGAAEGPDDVPRIYRELIVITKVTVEEHTRLDRAHKSARYDAMDGDWCKRYALAGVEVFPLTEKA